MDQSPKLLAAEHGQKHLVESQGVEVRVGVFPEAANTLLHQQNSTRGAGGHAVKDFERVEEVEEEIAHVAKHFDGRCEAVNILDGIVPLAQENEVLQVRDAEEHVRLLDKPEWAYVQRMDQNSEPCRHVLASKKLWKSI